MFKKRRIYTKLILHSGLLKAFQKTQFKLTDVILGQRVHGLVLVVNSNVLHKILRMVMEVQFL